MQFQEKVNPLIGNQELESEAIKFKNMPMDSYVLTYGIEYNTVLQNALNDRVNQVVNSEEYQKSVATNENPYKAKVLTNIDKPNG